MFSIISNFKEKIPTSNNDLDKNLNNNDRTRKVLCTKGNIWDCRENLSKIVDFLFQTMEASCSYLILEISSLSANSHQCSSHGSCLYDSSSLSFHHQFLLENISTACFLCKMPFSSKRNQRCSNNEFRIL